MHCIYTTDLQLATCSRSVLHVYQYACIVSQGNTFVLVACTLSVYKRTRKRSNHSVDLVVYSNEGSRNRLRQ